MIGNLKSDKKLRSPFERYYIYIFCLLLGFILADLTILYVRPLLLPSKAPPVRPSRLQDQMMAQRADYSGIVRRNLFNEDGKVPPPLSADGKEGLFDDGPAVPSQLPLSLEGTLVHANPKRSVSTIQLRSKNETKSFVVDDEIEGLARITKIERRKVTFRNLSNNRLEFIEIPKESLVNFGMKQDVEAPKSEDVIKRSDFDFSMKREDINKYLSNFTGVLNQARMVPNIIPGTGGRVEGFRFVSIDPGSIYERLGFKAMDVIKSVNGQSVNSPTKAMELYQSFRNEDRIQITIERNGRNETLNYTVMP